MSTGQTVGDAFGSILAANFALLSDWQGAARNWEDIEGVHQMRVAFRRMRSALGVFRAAVPKRVTARWSEEMRWLGSRLGPARDLDVFITEGLDCVEGKLMLPGAPQIRTLADERREAAYRQVREMLDGQRYGEFQRGFGRWLGESGWTEEQLGEKSRAKLESGVVRFARKSLDRIERKVSAVGSSIDKSRAEDLHGLRIQCKKLRYAAEFFSPLFPGMGDFGAHLKGLQDLLGVLNDVSVMHGILDELLTGSSDPAALQYAGALVGWRTRQYFEIRDSFDDRWEEFAHANHPWWDRCADSARQPRGTTPGIE